MSDFPELQKRFTEGDNIALIDVLRATIQLNMPLPEWAKGEILGALNGWRFADYVSLDEAFGVQREQFRQVKEQRTAQTMPKTYCEIEDLRKGGLSLEAACSELARRRSPDNPDYEEDARTIRRDYTGVLHELKKPPKE